MTKDELKSKLEEQIDKAVYHGVLNVPMELKKEISKSIQDYGNRFVFSDIFFRDEFARLLYDFLDERITSEQLKEKIKDKLAYGNNLLLNDTRTRKKA